VPDDPSATRAARPTSRFDARIRRVVATRRIFPVLLVATLLLALLAGFIATLVAPEDFPTFGVGVWWAIVTLGTVGYGDVVPTNTWGRVVGSATIIVGVTFLSFLTAIVTSLFISNDEEERAVGEREERAASEAETRSLLLRLDERLATIEARLEQLTR
jgi:voltage-gated potassium channel